jgi:hypothetical protein
MLIKAISRRMTNCSMTFRSDYGAQFPCVGFSVPAIDSRMPVSD